MFQLASAPYGLLETPHGPHPLPSGAVPVLFALPGLVQTYSELSFGSPFTHRLILFVLLFSKYV